MINNNNINVILYCRVSSDEQAEGCSLNEQERQLRSYCTNNGYNVIDVYKEDFSARKYDLNRPEMKKIYEYCKKHRGKVNKVLFLRWDRYARNVEFAFAYKRRFYDELGVEINTIESPIDFQGTEWAMMMGIYCGVAHTEDEKISRRTKDGIHGTLLKGRCANKAPRGYKNVNTNGEKYVVIDKEKAPLVRYAFEEVAKGLKTPTMVMKEIRKKGMNICKSAFFEMLHNHFYCGEIHVPAYLNEPAQFVKGIHEPLISKETFLLVQSRFNKENKRRDRSKKPKIQKYPHIDYYFYPFLLCPCCGEKITASHSKGRNKVYAYYHCNHCGKYRVPADKMNEDILCHIRQIRPCQAVLDLYEEVLNDLRANKFKDINKKKQRIQEDVKKVELRLERLQDRYLDGDISTDEYKSIRQRYSDEIYTLKSQLEIMKTPNRNYIEPQMAYATSFINNMERCILSVEIEGKMEVLNSIFKGKMVFENGKCRTAEYNPIIPLLVGKSSYYKTKGASANAETPLQYLRPESNRHARNGHRILSPARLPIPPLRHLSCLKKIPIFYRDFFERKTRLELATPTLARSCSTN